MLAYVGLWNGIEENKTAVGARGRTTPHSRLFNGCLRRQPPENLGQGAGFEPAFRKLYLRSFQHTVRRSLYRPV